MLKNTQALYPENPSMPEKFAVGGALLFRDLHLHALFLTYAQKLRCD